MGDYWRLWTGGMTAKSWIFIAFAVIGAALLVAIPITLAFGGADRTACGELEARVVSAGEVFVDSYSGRSRRFVQQIVEAQDGHRYQLRYARNPLEPGDRVRIITMCDGRGEKLFQARVRRAG